MPQRVPRKYLAFVLSGRAAVLPRRAAMAPDGLCIRPPPATDSRHHHP